MPSVMIWLPHSPENRYGHAALRTDKYHISLRPHKTLGNFKRHACALAGVEAEIVFAQEEDDYRCGKRPPDYEHELKDNITNTAINRVYEEILEYNGIDPAEVSLRKAGEILNEWTSLPGDMKEECNIHEKFAKKMCKTKYSYIGKDVEGLLALLLNSSFYVYPQSCTTFCLHILRGILREADPCYKFSEILLANIPKPAQCSFLPFGSPISSEILPVPLFNEMILADFADGNVCLGRKIGCKVFVPLLTRNPLI